MKFLKKLFSGLSGGASEDTFSFYLECAKCGEKIEVRINRRADLASEYRDMGESGPAYILRKEVLGNNCPNIIEVSMEFDRGRKVTSRDVRGGKFVEVEEGEA
jgi:hypothetical protein